MKIGVPKEIKNNEFRVGLTPDSVSKLSSNHKEIRIYKNKRNLGIGEVRNLIIKKSRGEFLAFFDDDDESMPERLKWQYERILEYEKNFRTSSLVICHTSRKVIYPNGRIRIERTLGTKMNSKSPFGLSVAKRILLGEPLKDGYGACPLTVAYGKVMLAEFCYAGKVTPSFPFDPTKPSSLYWQMKSKLFPWLQWNVMFKGKEWAKPTHKPLEK